MGSQFPKKRNRVQKAEKESGKPYHVLVDEANQILAYCASTLRNCSVPFGASMSDLSPMTQITSLVADRIVNKFSVKSQSTHLRDVAIMAFKQYEEQIQDVSAHWAISDNIHQWTVRRRLLHLLKGYRLDFSQDIDVGPGETYVSSHGMTSLLAKLAMKDHWTTTHEALEATVQLIYEHRALKRAAKLHMPVLTRKERVALYAQYSTHPHPGYGVFRHMLVEHVLTLTAGSRGSTVPKNANTDRFINIEPLFPMILQRYVASALKRCLKAHGNGLVESDAPSLFKASVYHDRQGIHADMIANPDYATIDFKNASDSVLLKVVQSLFPQKVVGDLMMFRSRFVNLQGSDHELIKLSSMGNGFTFEVMTTLLLAACHVFTKDCSVYGDDVIIPNEHAEDFISLCASFGFNANMKKTFINSPFRESCGAFYLDGKGYLTSFDIRFCECYNDVITATNKIYLILKYHREDLSPMAVSTLEDTHALLLNCSALSRSGPCPRTKMYELSNIGLYFYKDNAVRKAKSSPVLVERWKKWVNKLGAIMTDYQWDIDVNGDRKIAGHNFLVINISLFKPRRVVDKRHRTLNEMVRLKTNRLVRETVRGKGRWTEPLALVDITSGRVYLLSSLQLSQRLAKKGIYVDPQLP